MGVVVVPLIELTQHLVVGLRRAALFQLEAAPLRAHLGGRRQKDLHLGVRQHHRANVAPVHNDAVLPRQIALHFQQERAHRRQRRHGARVHGDLRQPDLARHVLSIEQHVLLTVRLVAHTDLQLRQDRADSGFVARLNAAPLHRVADRAVDRAGIHIQNAELRRDRLGQRAFPRAGGAVHRDGTVLFGYHRLLFPHSVCKVYFLYRSVKYSAAASPAALPVAHAICRLKPPV